MNLKLILIFALCFLIIYVAFKIFLYYKQRQQFYENLTDFCSYLELQITFLKEDIQKIVNTKQNYYNNEREKDSIITKSTKEKKDKDDDNKKQKNDLSNADGKNKNNVSEEEKEEGEENNKSKKENNPLNKEE